MNTIKTAVTVAQLAHRYGYATQARKGKLRFVTVAYGARGKSTVEPRSDWLTADDALEVLRENTDRL